MKYILYAIPVFFVLIGIEVLAAWIRKRDCYRLNDSVNDLSCGILQQVTGVFLRTALLAGYFFLYDHYRFFTIPGNSVAAWIAIFLGVDFFYYWFHRTSHVMNAPWAAHVVHHQSEEYNLSVALRQGAFQPVFSSFFYLPLALAGFHPAMFITTASFNTLYQFWIHTRLIGKLGPLEWVLNTPSHHRVHHGRNPKYLDKNHGGSLIIWDRMFGTFQAEEEEPVYGLTKPLNSWNPLWANLHVWVDLFRDAYHAPRWSDKLKIWFMHPRWQPAGMGPREMPAEVDREHYHKYDTQVPAGLAAYIFLHFAVFPLGVTYFLEARNDLTQTQLYTAAGLIVLSLLNFGGLFELRRWAWIAEPLRLVAIGAVAIVSMRTTEHAWIGSIGVGLGVLACGVWVLRYRSARRTPTAPLVAAG